MLVIIIALSILLVIVIVFLVVFMVRASLLRESLAGKQEELLEKQGNLDEKQEELIRKQEELGRIEVLLREKKKSHKDGLSRQAGIVSATILEKYLPFFLEFPYDIRDFVPVFNTCDGMILVGRGETGVVKELVIQETKTKRVPLSPLQESLRECVEEKRVRFEVWVWDKKTGKYSIERHFRPTI